MEDTVAVVLAAGLSKRMRSDTIKILHPVGGRQAVARVVDACHDLARVVVVVGHQGDRVRDALAHAEVTFVEQADPRGTGDAVLRAEATVAGAADVLVLYGDGAVLTSALIAELLRRHRAGGAAATLLTGQMDDPAGYGRVVRGADGGVRAIVEEADCTPEQRGIREWYTGVACYRRSALYGALRRVGTDNAKGEVYLTDAVGILARTGHRVDAFCSPRAEEAIGVDDRADLAEAERIIRARVIARLFEAGVTVRDPATTYVDERAEIGQDTVLEPMTIIDGPCRIGRHCIIGPGSHLVRSELGERVRVTHSVVEESRVAEDCIIGPFAHLRPGTVLGRDVEVGNFAEIKNSAVGAGSKAHHHSYIGDADLGERVNVGAGLITVNYDGRSKHRSVVAADAFLGCNVNLIAPVTVGKGAYVAAGSTVNQPVPDGSLAIARERQTNKPEWAARRAAQHEEKG